MKKCINCKYYFNYLGLEVCSYLRDNKKSDYLNPLFIYTESKSYQFNKCIHFEKGGIYGKRRI